MSVRRILGSSLLLIGAAACFPQTGVETPKPLKPEDGPRGSIYATYSGGIFLRTVNAFFRVEEAAYVIVAHLGGDGVIRVLYPQSPREYAFVRAKKTLQTGHFYGRYDGAPSLYTFTANPFRGLGASMDSYDGRGHGYVFMIATRTYMSLGQLVDRNEWLDVEIEDYQWTHDPRFAIRDFAETIAGGEPFTLKFAHSFSTQSFTTYAAAAWDCALLSSYGMQHGYGFWGSRRASSSWFLGHSGFSSCGMSAVRSYAWNDRGPTYGPRNPITNVPVAPNPPLTPRLARPGYRPVTEPSPAVLVTRSGLNRGGPTTRASAGGHRNREVESRRRAAVDENTSRPFRTTRENPARSSDETRGSRPRETSHTEPRSRSAESPRMDTPRPAATSRVETPRPAASPRSQEARHSPPSAVKPTPPPKPEPQDK